ncbi:BACON domain-containing protein [Flavitalea antarctica]
MSALRFVIYCSFSLLICCQKAPIGSTAEPAAELSIDKTTLSFSAKKGENGVIVIRSNVNWKITTKTAGVSWLSFNKVTGSKTDTVTISCIADNLGDSVKKAIVVFSPVASAQEPKVEIEISQAGADPVDSTKNAFGGSQPDSFNDVIATPDGNYLAIGYTSSKDGDAPGGSKQEDIWLVKFNPTSQIIWQKKLASDQRDFGGQLIYAHGSGYLLTGSLGPVVSKGTIIKIDENGNLLWQKLYGGSNGDGIGSIAKTADGGYIACGGSQSADGDIPANKGFVDSWVIKIDGDGKLLWSKTYGGSYIDYFSFIKQNADGSYTTIGTTGSFDGDVVGNHPSSSDAWVVNLDASGKITGQRCFGSEYYEAVESVTSTTDGGYVIACVTNSKGGGDVLQTGFGDYDSWVIKVDAAHKILWSKMFGGSGRDLISSVSPTSDNGYVLAGSTFGPLPNITGLGKEDGWVFKLNSSGQMLGEKLIGGSMGDYAYKAIESKQGGYIVVGFTVSRDFDIHGHSDSYSEDAWFMKFKF